MYSENEKQYSRRRSNDEFLRRIRGEEFLAGLSAGSDIPTISRMDTPQVDERVRTACDGSNNATNRQDANYHCHMPSLAMVYSPFQEWQDLLSPEEGLAHGSIFTELIKPLEVGNGSSCLMGGGCHK